MNRFVHQCAARISLLVLVTMLGVADAARGGDDLPAPPAPDIERIGHRWTAGVLDKHQVTGRIYSEQTGEHHEVTDELRVWLPSAYLAQPKRSFPVLYLCQAGIGHRLTRRIESGDYPPMILVSLRAPQAERVPGSAQHAWDDVRVSALSHFIDNVIGRVDRLYRTQPERTGRGLLGISKGGGGVLCMLLKRPDLFSGAVSVDGALDMCDFEGADSHEALVRQNVELHARADWLSILGGWFWSSTEKRLPMLSRAFGAVDVVDRRHWDHACQTMLDMNADEILTTMVNGMLNTPRPRPVISTATGTSELTGATEVSIKVDEPASTIHYTLDGTEPTVDSPKYTGPVEVRPDQAGEAETATHHSRSITSPTLRRELIVRARAFDGAGHGGRFAVQRLRFHEPLKPSPQPEQLNGGLRATYLRGGDADVQVVRGVRTTLGQEQNESAEEITGGFEATFEGFLQLDAGGIYLFKVEADDRVKAQIGDQPFRGRWMRVALQPGLHPLSIEFEEKHGPPSIELLWLRPNSEELAPVLDGSLKHR